MATKTICRRAAVWDMCPVVHSCTNPAGGDAVNETFSVLYTQNGATSGSVPADSNSYSTGDAVTVGGNTAPRAQRLRFYPLVYCSRRERRQLPSR